MFKTHIYLPEEALKQLEQLSKLTSRSRSELIREAVHKYLESREGDKFQIASLKPSLRRAQDIIKKHNKHNISLVDSLKASRKAELKKE